MVSIFDEIPSSLSLPGARESLNQVAQSLESPQFIEGARLAQTIAIIGLIILNLDFIDIQIQENVLQFGLLLMLLLEANRSDQSLEKVVRVIALTAPFFLQWVNQMEAINFMNHISQLDMTAQADALARLPEVIEDTKLQASMSDFFKLYLLSLVLAQFPILTEISSKLGDVSKKIDTESIAQTGIDVAQLLILLTPVVTANYDLVLPALVATLGLNTLETDARVVVLVEAVAAVAAILITLNVEGPLEQLIMNVSLVLLGLLNGGQVLNQLFTGLANLKQGLGNDK